MIRVAFILPAMKIKKIASFHVAVVVYVMVYLKKKSQYFLGYTGLTHQGGMLRRARNVENNSIKNALIYYLCFRLFVVVVLRVPFPLTCTPLPPPPPPPSPPLK